MYRADPPAETPRPALPIDSALSPDRIASPTHAPGLTRPDASLTSALNEALFGVRGTSLRTWATPKRG